MNNKYAMIFNYTKYQHLIYCIFRNSVNNLFNSIIFLFLKSFTWVQLKHNILRNCTDGLTPLIAIVCSSHYLKCMLIYVPNVNFIDFG